MFNIINVFTVTFDQLDASFKNTIFFFFPLTTVGSCHTVSSLSLGWKFMLLPVLGAMLKSFVVFLCLLVSPGVTCLLVNLLSVFPPVNI